VTYTNRTDRPDDWAEDEAAERAAAEANSSDEFLASCALCMERPGVIETASGDYICEECYMDRADREYERLKERGYDP